LRTTPSWVYLLPSAQSPSCTLLTGLFAIQTYGKAALKMKSLVESFTCEGFLGGGFGVFGVGFFWGLVVVGGGGLVFFVFVFFGGCLGGGGGLWWGFLGGGVVLVLWWVLSGGQNTRTLRTCYAILPGPNQTRPFSIGLAFCSELAIEKAFPAGSGFWFNHFASVFGRTSGACRRVTMEPCSFAILASLRISSHARGVFFSVMLL